MKFLAPIALAVIGTEVAALNLKPKATHVAKTHRAHPVKEVEETLHKKSFRVLKSHIKIIEIRSKTPRICCSDNRDEISQ